MADTKQQPPGDDKHRLEHGYNRMLERVREALGGKGTLHDAVERAKERARELGELTREESEHIGDYLRRDLQDAAAYLSDTGEQLGNWLRFDLELAEARIMETFSQVVDQSRIELEQFTRTGRKLGERYTGEVTGPGRLVCDQCGEELQFERTGRIPPCPRCHATVFSKRY